jgi:multicomponent Na+:H+ antiporter subunit D
MNGFISKLAVVRGGITAESWVVLGLVVAAGMITLLYMTRTWQLIFQQNPTDQTVALKDYGDKPYAPLLLIALSVLLGLYAAPLIDVVQMTVDQIAEPSIYINAVLGGL